MVSTDAPCATSNAVLERLQQHPRLKGFLAAIASAALFVLAFPTTELAPLALFALVPLVMSLRTRTRWQRFRLGWLVGFLVELALFRWIPFTMDQMTSLPDPVAWLMWFTYAGWHGMRIGIFAMLAEPLRRAAASRRPALAPIGVALLYTSVEWLWPVIFPWALGHALWELPLTGAVLALQGVPLMTFVIALVNVAIADALVARSSRVRRRPPLVELVTLGLIVVIAFAAAPSADGRSLRVAVIQPNYTLAEKKQADLAMRKRLLDRFEGLIRGLPPESYDLVLASEGSFPLWWRVDADRAEGSSFQLRATRRVQRAIAEGPRAAAIFGGLRRDEQNRSRNSAIHFAADGRILGVYDKQTLVPFSEYVPFSDIFPALGEIRGIGRLVPGEKPCRFQIGDNIEVSCGICYETMFAADTRRDASAAALLVNLTIDTWFGSSTAPRMHLMSHTSRAAELGVPLIRAALTGISAIVDHRGLVIAALPADAPGVLTFTVPLADGATLYRAIGQVFAPLATALCLVALFDASRRRRTLGSAEAPA